jgi:hypothetical protein
MGQLSVDALFDAVFHAFYQIDRADKVNHQSIPGHLSELIFTSQGVVIFIQHSYRQVSSPQIDSNLDPPLRG